MRIGMLVAAATVTLTLGGCGDPMQSFGAKGPGAAPGAAADRPGPGTGIGILRKPHKCERNEDACPVIVVEPSKAQWVDDPIVIYHRRKRDLVFEVEAGYKFDQQAGIVVADDVDQKYTCEKDASNVRRYNCEYKNRNKFGIHKYAIKVVRDSDSQTLIYDPYFINE